MHPRAERRLRPIAVIVLFFFTWISIEPWHYAVWAQSSPASPSVPQSQPKTRNPSPSASGGFEETLRATQKLIEDLDQEVASGKDITLTLETLKGHRQVLESTDPGIRAEFAATEKFLKEKGLPTVILDRQAQAVANYEANYKQLKDNLDSIILLESDRKKAEDKKDSAQAESKRKDLQAKIKAAKDYLTAKVKKPRHQPLDPNNLPHRTPKVKERKPRLKKEEFAEFQKPIQLAYNGDPTPLLVAQSTTDLPTGADLAETIEVQFTPELQQITTLLQNDPVLLYEFVRNNFVYEPYYGSVKGSQSTLLLQGGNDFDQASLLIALLRFSGIPARYVYGTVEIPISKAMNWLGGVTKSEVVGEILASNGIPAKLIYLGGVPASVQLEHVWVEAYLPYTNYRGKLNDPNAPKSWIPLDPSFKLNDPNPNATDLADLQQFDIDSYFDSYVQTIKPTTPAKDYLTTTVNYVTANLPGQRFYDLLASGPIIEKVLDLLPSTLAYPVKVVGARFSTIADTYRHRITLEFIDPNFFETTLSYTTFWPTLLHKRFTLSYKPATASDEQTVAAYGGLYSTPPYLIQVKPVLKVEGVTVAEGTAINMAGDVTLEMSFVGSQGILEDVVTNTLVAGADFAIGLDAGQTTGLMVRKRMEKLEAAVNTGESGDSVLGERFNLYALTYLEQLDSSRKMIAKTMKLLDTNHVAELMVGVDLVVSYLFGAPKSVEIGGVLIDVDRNISTTFDMAGDHAKARRFHVLAGMTSSALEHTVFEAVIGAEAVSAIKALEVASTQGIPIHRVDKSNLATELTALQLNSEVETDIKNAVNAGLEVTVSERNIQLNNWNGVGYIALDPATGTGAYQISGGFSGGALTQIAPYYQIEIESAGMSKETAAQEILNMKKSLWFFPPADCVESRGFSFVPKHLGIDFVVPQLRFGQV
jgi:hypothetical protein